MKRQKNSGAWKYFFLSFILPVIGGIITYFTIKNKDKNLATICLTVSIFHPFLAVFFTSFFTGFLLGLFGIGVEILENYVLLLWPISLILFTIILIQIFKSNPYHPFIPIWYLGLLGFIFSYYYYDGRQSKVLKRDMGIFFLAQIIASFLLLIVMNLLFSSQYGGYDIIVNETITLEPNYYYVYSFYVPPGNNILQINLKSQQSIRFILLRPLECLRFQAGESYYYEDQAEVTELISEYLLASEGEWCIVLMNTINTSSTVSIEAAITYESLF